MAAPHHIVVFPAPAQGHVNPLALLAQYFVDSGLSVTFIHSARSFRLLSSRSSNPSSLPSSNPRIEVVPDVFPVDDKANISRKEFLDSFPLMEQGLEEVLHKLTKEFGKPPSCIVTDNFLPWTQGVAEKHGIPRIEFCTMSATAMAMTMGMSELGDKGYLPLQSGSESKLIDFIPGVRPFPLRNFPKGFAICDDVTSADFQFFCSASAHMRKVDRVLVNSFYDLESVVIDALRAQQIPIDCVGPLVSLDRSVSNKTLSSGSLLPEDATCLGWLDAQQKSSVLYISFGSLAKADDESFEELAIGLEASQQSFLWVIRPDVVKGSLDDLFPEGFQSRTQGRGRIISWAPQVAVLAHPAVGAFLSHCGWNSTLESLCTGVPVIGFPIGGEQNTNLQLLIEWKVGMGLDEEGGAKCNRVGVERVIRAMMGGEEGKEARRRAAELKKGARNAMEKGSSKANLERLVEDIKHGRLKPSITISN